VAPPEIRSVVTEVPSVAVMKEDFTFAALALVEEADVQDDVWDNFPHRVQDDLPNDDNIVCAIINHKLTDSARKAPLAVESETDVQGITRI